MRSNEDFSEFMAYSVLSHRNGKKRLSQYFTVLKLRREAKVSQKKSRTYFGDDDEFISLSYITDMNVRHQEEHGAASLTPAPITCLPTWLLGRVLDSLPYPLHRPDELVRALAGLRSTHRCFSHEIVEGAARRRARQHKALVVYALEMQSVPPGALTLEEVWAPVEHAARKTSWMHAVFCTLPELRDPHRDYQDEDLDPHLTIFVKGQNTGMPPGRTAGFSAFQIATRIKRGSVEIINGFIISARSSRFVSWLKWFLNESDHEVNRLHQRVQDRRKYDTWAELVPWARKTALHPGFVERINGPLGDVCMRCFRYRHRTLGEAWEPSELDSLRHPLPYEQGDSPLYLNVSLLQRLADLMRPRESLHKALRRLSLEKEFFEPLRKHSKIFSINLRSKTREGILEHASYLMRSPAVKCLCRWWPSEDDSEDEEKVETEEFVLANLLGDSLFADGMDGDDY